MRRRRRIIALAAAAWIGWGALAEDPAVCAADAAEGPGHHDGGAPAAPHCCLACPCRTPVDATVTRSAVSPVPTVAAMVSAPDAAPASADAPAPPTPPPTLLA